MPRPSVPPLAVAALLAATPPSFADTPAQVPLVEAGGGGAPIAPTAPVLNATQPTSSIGRDALAQFVAPTGNYDDAIRLTPSVLDVSPNGPGLGAAQVLSIRGFVDGQYNVTFDGIPFADSDDFSHHSSAYFFARDLASVSVDRGPGDASTIGDATFGGTVALASIDPGPAATVSPLVSIGGRATRAVGLRFDSGDGTLPDGARALVDLEGVESRGTLDVSPQSRGAVFAKAILPVSATTRLTLASSEARIVQSEPLGATQAEIASRGPSVALDDDPSSQAFAPFNASVYRTDLSYAFLATALPGGATLTDRLYTYGLFRHFRQGLDPNGETPNGTPFGPDDVPGQAGFNGLRAWGDILRLVQPLARGLSLETGAWVERQTNSRSLLETDLTRGGRPAPVLDAVAGVPGSAAIDRDQREVLVTAQPYAQLAVAPLAWLALTAGIKEALFDRSVDAPVMEGTRVPIRFDRSVASPVPAFTAHARLGTGWSAYLQLARGFLAPALQLYDVADPARAAVPAQSTWNVQLGTVRRLAGGGSIAADLYAIQFDDETGTRTVGGETQAFDEGRVTYRGAEAEATLPLRAGLSLYGSASANHAHQSASAIATGGPAPATPQATLAGALLWRSGGFEASAIESWTGGSYGDVGGAHWIDPNAQLDLAASDAFEAYRRVPVTVRAQLFNLLDRRRIDGFAGYTVAAGTPLFWTQAGRTVFVTASTSF